MPISKRLIVAGMTDPQSATPASDDLKTALRKHGAVAALVSHIAGSKQTDQDTGQAPRVNTQYFPDTAYVKKNAPLPPPHS